MQVLRVRVELSANHISERLFLINPCTKAPFSSFAMDLTAEPHRGGPIGFGLLEGNVELEIICLFTWVPRHLEGRRVLSGRERWVQHGMGMGGKVEGLNWSRGVKAQDGDLEGVTSWEGNREDRADTLVSAGADSIRPDPRHSIR